MASNENCRRTAKLVSVYGGYWWQRFLSSWKPQMQLWEKRPQNRQIFLLDEKLFLTDLFWPSQIFEWFTYLLANEAEFNKHARCTDCESPLTVSDSQSSSLRVAKGLFAQAPITIAFSPANGERGNQQTNQRNPQLTNDHHPLCAAWEEMMMERVSITATIANIAQQLDSWWDTPRSVLIDFGIIFRNWTDILSLRLPV